MVILNRTPLQLRIVSGDATVGVVSPRSRAVFSLPRGRHVLKALDTQPRPAVVARREVLVGPRPVRWEIERPQAKLTLVNRTSEALDVVVGGKPGFHLARGAAWTDHVDARLLNVRGTGVESRVRYDLRPELREGEHRSLDFRERQGALTVHNASREPVAVAVDGRAYGVVRPGQSKRIDGLAVGTRAVSAEGRRTERKRDWKVKVVPAGGTLRMELAEARRRR